MLQRMERAITRCAILGEVLSFSLAIDATKVAPVIDVSTSHKAIMGGAFPNHMISTIDLDRNEIKAILDQSPSAK